MLAVHLPGHPAADVQVRSHNEGMPASTRPTWQQSAGAVKPHVNNDIAATTVIKVTSPRR